MFPGESAEYRAARDRLLEQEVGLRWFMETVAARRPCRSWRARVRLDHENGEAATKRVLLVAGSGSPHVVRVGGTEIEVEEPSL